MPLGKTYASDRNDDGTFNVRDVPIFAECSKVVRGDDVVFTKAWLSKAVERARVRAGEGNYAPLKIRHGTSSSLTKPEPAGKVFPKRLGKLTIDGEEVAVVFGDYLEVPEHVHRRMVRGELPGVSIEAYDYREAVIDAVALLDASDVAHVPFAVFRAAEVPPETVPAGAPDALTTLDIPRGVSGYFALGFSRVGFARFDLPNDTTPPDDKGEKKPKTPPEGGPPDKGDGSGDGGAQGSEDKITKAILESEELAVAIRTMVKTMLSGFAGGAPGAQTDPNQVVPPQGTAKPGESGAPHDPSRRAPFMAQKTAAELEAEKTAADATRRQAEADAAAAGAKGPGDLTAQLSKTVTDLTAALARIDALEGEKKTRDSETANVAAVDACLGRLAQFSLPSTARARLLENVRKNGLGVLDVYEATVKEHGTPAPAGIAPEVFARATGGAAGSTLPPEVLEFTGKPDFERAVACSREYDTLRKQGRLEGVTLKEHLKYQLNGFSAAK